MVYKDVTTFSRPKFQLDSHLCCSLQYLKDSFSIAVTMWYAASDRSTEISPPEKGAERRLLGIEHTSPPKKNDRPQSMHRKSTGGRFSHSKPLELSCSHGRKQDGTRSQEFSMPWGKTVGSSEADSRRGFAMFNPHPSFNIPKGAGPRT